MRYLIGAILLLGLAACAANPVPYGHPDFLPTPERPIGFRGDWGGRYPGATPPREWSSTYNVIWKRAVGVGESSPIVVGDRVFILTDGIRLQCLRGATGEVLWEKTTHAKPDVPEEAKAAQWEAVVVLQHQARRADDVAKRADRRIAGLKADADRRKQPVDEKALAPLQTRMAEAQAQSATARAAQAKLMADPALAPDARYVSTASYAISTPCSDGKLVYVYLPTGEVVCYDLDGNRQWLRLLGARRAGGGWQGAQVGPSPLLADGTLVIHYDKVYGLEAATGKTRWEVASGRGSRAALPIPSPIPLKVGDTWYAMMGTGRALRVADGKYVFDPAWSNDCTVQSPVAYDNLFCWVGCAVQMPDKADGEAKVAWTLSKETMLAAAEGAVAPKHMLGWHGYACPTYADGKVYYQAEHKKFSVFDARTGDLLFNSDAVSSGAVYPSLTLAGDLIISSNERGESVLVTRAIGPDFRVLARNQLGRLGGNMFVPVGNRMLIHAEEDSADGLSGDGMVYCLGDPLAEAPATFRPDPATVKRDAPTTGAALLALLDDPDDLAVFTTLRTLKTPDDAATIVPELAKRVTSGDARKATMALLALRALGPRAKGAVPALVPLLDPGYGKTHTLCDLPARDALTAIGPLAAGEMLAAARTPRGVNERAMLSVLGIVGGFGPEAIGAAPALKTLAAGTGRVADAAKAALAKVKPEEKL